MLTILPPLSEETLRAANLIGEWLAQDDFSLPPKSGGDGLLVLAGNAVIPVIDAAFRLAAGGKATLLISGGIGHSTPFLYAAIARHPRYNRLPTTGRPEAAILADIAHQFWRIPRERILLEDRSTNCGENARFTRELLESRGLFWRTGIVMQDPTMQRRTMATFARVWRDAAVAPSWLSYPGCHPRLCNGTQGVTFAGDADGLWSVDRYLSLLLGELPRLRDDEQGYGPRGRDFIAHVDIPPQVEEAGRMLAGDQRLARELASRSLR